MSKEIILKRCPSCGAEAKVERYAGSVERVSEEVRLLSNWLWRVRCKYCSFKCDGFQVRSNAIKRWNTRCKEVSSGPKV